MSDEYLKVVEDDEAILHLLAWRSVLARAKANGFNGLLASDLAKARKALDLVSSGDPRGTQDVEPRTSTRYVPLSDRLQDEITLGNGRIEELEAERDQLRDLLEEATVELEDSADGAAMRRRIEETLRQELAREGLVPREPS